MKKALSDFQKMVFGIPEEEADFNWKEIAFFYGFLTFLISLAFMGVFR